MVSFRCEEVQALPDMTVRGSCHTALELRSKFHLTRFALDFDDSLPEGLLQVSSDLHGEIFYFLSGDSKLGKEHEA